MYLMIQERILRFKCLRYRRKNARLFYSGTGGSGDIMNKAVLRQMISRLGLACLETDKKDKAVLACLKIYNEQTCSCMSYDR